MFDLRRFGRLAAVQWAEHRREYLWFFGIGIAVHACMWLVITDAGRNRDHYVSGVQAALYLVGYLITSLIFAGRHFAALARRDAALTWLMRPASSFEKFLLTFLIVAVAYPLAYTLAFQVCNLPGALVGAEAEALKENTYRRDLGPYLPFTGRDRPFAEAALFVGVAALQALVLAGMLYFKALSWLKTLVAVFILVVVALPLLTVFAGASPGELLPGTGGVPTGSIVTAWLWTLWIGVPGLLWASVYGFMRERELT